MNEHKFVGISHCKACKNTYCRLKMRENRLKNQLLRLEHVYVNSEHCATCLRKSVSVEAPVEEEETEPEELDSSEKKRIRPKSEYWRCVYCGKCMGGQKRLEIHLPICTGYIRMMAEL